MLCPNSKGEIPWLITLLLMASVIQGGMWHKKATLLWQFSTKAKI